MDHDTLGSRIEQARIAKGYTISQLSRRMAVKPSTLKNWESDRSEPRANKLSMLVGVLVSPPAGFWKVAWTIRPSMTP